MSEKYKTNTKVYIVIVNYNGWYDTIELLENLQKIDYINFQIIVVDNNSTNQSYDYIQAWANGELDIWCSKDNALRRLSYPPSKKPIRLICSLEEELDSLSTSKSNESEASVVLIKANENNGFAAGNNIALKYALNMNDFSYVWLLNNDAVVENNSLSELVKHLESDNSLAAVGSKILYYSEPDILQNIGSVINASSYFKLCKPILNIKNKIKDVGQYDKNLFVNDIMGSSILISRKIIEKVGLMPEEYFLYGEETDWNYQFQKNGKKLMTIYTSKVYHKKSISVGGDDSPLSVYYRTRNQFILNKKYMNKYKYYLFISLYVIKKTIDSFALDKKQRNVLYKAIVDGFKGLQGRSYKH